MDARELNVDYTERVVVNVDELPYAASPAAGVWRKRLELSGDGEHGRVTSVVRFDPGAHFPEHDHPGGEEVLVLDGHWCDERGSFGPGSYQLNPESFRHAPFTRTGCTLLVKLRQYVGPERPVVLVDTNAGSWIERGPSGVRSLPLYRSEEHGEYVRLTQLAPGAIAPRVDLPDGEEIFVLSGAFSDEYGEYARHTWLRLPRGHRHSPRATTGCLLYVKSGGFPR